MNAQGKLAVRELRSGEPENGFAESALLLERVEAGQNVLPYLRLFWEHRRLLLRAALWSLAASVLIAFLIPVRFQSVTRLMPPDNQSSSGLSLLAALAGRSSTGGLGGFASDLLGGKSSGALFVGILGSETVQDRLIEEFQLQKVYGDSKIEDARSVLADRTSLGEDRKSGIISIAVTDHDPKRAAALAQAYAHQLDRLVAQVSTSSARRERIFLEERLKKVKTDLDSAARSFSDFASKNTAIDIPAQGKAMVAAAANLQGELIAAQAELSGLRQIYTGNNVRARAAQARVNELQKKLNEIGGAGTPSEVNSDNALYPSIRKLPLLGVPYADLYRETKIQETVYELLTQQYELAKVQEAKEIPTVKVLDEAAVRTKKSFPPRLLIAILGTMLGLALAMAWIVVETRWQAADASHPGKVLATEVFTTMRGYVPRHSHNGNAAPSSVRGIWRRFNGRRTSAHGPDNPDPPDRP